MEDISRVLKDGISKNMSRVAALEVRHMILGAQEYHDRGSVKTKPSQRDGERLGGGTSTRAEKGKSSNRGRRRSGASSTQKFMFTVR